MSKRVAFDDDAMWALLRVVIEASEDKPKRTLGPDPPRVWMEMELAGWVWLMMRPGAVGYYVVPMPLGCSEAHRWAARQAKLAAHEFGRVG